jgi:hypothetical protein
VSQSVAVIVVAIAMPFPRAIVWVRISRGPVAVEEVMRVVEGVVEPLRNLVKELDDRLEDLQTRIGSAGSARRSCDLA